MPSFPGPELSTAVTGRSRPVRWHLAALAAALALPILGFVATLLWRVSVAERDRLEGEALNTARAASVALDRELTGLASALNVLALSASLQEGDLAAFHRKTVDIQDRLGISAVLRDRTGQQLVNVRSPWGAPLPKANLPEPEPEMWRSGRPVVSDLFVGAVARTPLFAVQVPVTRKGIDAPDILSLSLPVERIRQVILDQRPPAGWIVAVVDGNGLIVARNDRHEEFVGKSATRDLLENTRWREGTWRGTTADGARIFGAYSRSEVSGWRVAVGVPDRLFAAPLRRSLWILGGVGVALAVLSLLLALVFGRRIAAPLQTLAEQALALGRGKEVRPVVTSVREAARAGEALAAASFELRRREEELRNLNEVLEARVAERTLELTEANQHLIAAAAERESAEAQLRQAQKMEAVGQLTGGVAHDFNNLLTVIVGNLGMARRRLGEDGDNRVVQAIAGALEGARRAAALTQRLLAFSRQQPLAPEPVDANRLVSGMSDLLRRTLGEDVAIETVLAGGLWRAQADPNQLENALLNLAVNARDAMPKGGKLTIETSNTYLDEAYAVSRQEVCSGQYVAICVSDTGMGMSPDVVAKVFEPFFTTKPIGKGTGLGLSQVYGFAKQSGGHVAIYSELGQGTTVKLYLPRLRQAVIESTPSAAKPSELSLPAGRGETVLVVEDDQMVRDFAVAALEEAGYQVVAAPEGPSGLALLDAHPEVALLFTDVVLTGSMNGREVADAAGARRPDLKVLFTTGYTRNAIIHHGQLDDGIHFLGKPYTATALTTKVRELLDAPGR